MDSFRGKVVIITGASSGIGAQSAVEFSRRGATVILTARSLPRLQETAQKCKDVGGTDDKMCVVEAELTKDEDVHNIITTTVNKYNRIDVVVNNAGLARKADFSSGSVASALEDLDDMYRLNTRAPYLLTKLALPYLLQSKGNVVNVSSISAKRPLPYVFAYSVAKAALDHFTRTLALELAPKGVRVNGVNPGTVWTEIFTRSGYIQNEDQKDQLMKTMAAMHPFGRVGRPEEVALAVVFLASEEASFISGVTLPVDGARHTTSWIAKL